MDQTQQTAKSYKEAECAVSCPSLDCSIKRYHKLNAAHKSIQLCTLQVSHDNSVNVATRYGLDGPGIGSRGERGFSHSSRPSLGPTQWVLGVCPGDKAARA